MTRAFLSRSYSQRQTMLPVAEVIQQAAADATITVYDFVSINHFTPNEAVAMMRLSFDEIRAADFLIAEVSYKAVGVGIELGYAAALNKLILALRLETAELSTTISGIATLSLVYRNAADLARKLPSVLVEIIDQLP